MLWFNKQKEMRMEFIQNFRPTSKMQLLQVALWYHKGDMEKAQEMYDYYARNVSLPDTDPIAPSWMEQIKGNIQSFMDWAKENGTELAQGYEIIRSIVQNKGALPPIGIPSVSQEPLPPINE